MTAANLPAQTAPAQTETFDDKLRYCQALAGADILPRSFRDKPANLLYAIEYADSIGVSRMTALTGIHIIEGRPSASADLIAALIRRAGHKLRIPVSNSTECVVQIIRNDDPDFTFEVKWDVEKATTAGLWGSKGNWAKYPSAMLRARAITEAARSAASDVLHGLSYTPEELGAVVDESGEPLPEYQRAAARAPQQEQVAEVEQPRQQPRQQDRPKARQGGMAGLGQDLADAPSDEPSAEDEALFTSFLERVSAAETRDALIQLHNLAAQKFTDPEMVEAAQKLCADRAADLGVAKEKAKADEAPADEAQAQQAPTHQQAVEAVQEALVGDVVNPDGTPAS